MIRFGTGGLGDSFETQGYKKSTQAGEYLAGFGLNHYEYECGQGVRISDTSAKEIGAELVKQGIPVSVHAPYFISLSTTEE
jgi:deoxyribonuclease-4